MATARTGLRFALLSKLLKNETIYVDGEPYLTRFYLGEPNQRKIGEKPQVFIHFFHKSDQGVELHNHPYTGLGIMLAGGYREERITEVTGRTRDGRTETVFVEREPKVVAPGMVNELSLSDYHRTDLVDPEGGAWTIFVTGPRVKHWGFLNRATLAFFPYMSKTEEREGSGPHSRVHEDTGRTVRDAEGTRAERDAFDAARRAQDARLKHESRK